MKHVRQSLDVHQAMLDGDVEHRVHREAVGRAHVRIEDAARQFFIKGSSDLANIPSDNIEARPVRGFIGGQATSHGIDAERKESV